MRNYLPSSRDFGLDPYRAPQVRMRREPIPVAKAPVGASPGFAGSRRSMGRGVKVAGGQIDKAGLLQIGESGF
jgi:hypothetical protein